MTRKDIVQDIYNGIVRLQQIGTWPEGPIPEIHIEETDSDTQGDYICVTPIDLAVLLHRHPSGVARELKEMLKGEYEQVSISHPGVLHFFVNAKQLADDIQRIIEKGNKFGRTNSGRRQKIIVDVPSVNPAVPLTLADARRLYTADTLVRVLKETGHAVDFIASWDDAGDHIDRLGESVARRWMQQSGINVPYDNTLYHGDYILNMARTLNMKNYKLQNLKKIEWVKERMRSLAVKSMTERGRTLIDTSMQVQIDLWHSDSESTDIPDRLRRVIAILGGGYHGGNYVDRLHAAGVGEEVNIVRVHTQNVYLFMDGTRLSLEHKPGEAVSIEELLDEYDPETIRLLFVQEAADSELDFDINAVSDDSHGNPLVMMQDTLSWLQSYAQRAANLGIPKNTPVALQTDEEQELARELVVYPQLLDEIALSGQVTKLTRYSVGLARSIWRLHFGIPDDGAHVKKEQVSLLRAAQHTLENAMRVLGLNTDRAVNEAKPGNTETVNESAVEAATQESPSSTDAPQTE